MTCIKGTPIRDVQADGLTMEVAGLAAGTAERSMGMDGYRLGRVEAWWAILIALALLLVPVAGLRAAPCDGHGRRPVTAMEVVTAPHQGGAHHDMLDKACCGTASCSVPLFAPGTTGAAPGATVTGTTFALHDQAGRGLNLPPTLGPPRLPA